MRAASVGVTVLLLALVALATSGCIKTPKKSGMMKGAEDLQDMTSAELRLKVHAFASRFERAVEGTADMIMEETDDPVIRRRALRFKLYVIPEMQRAAFHYDPLAGLIDAAALTGQLRQFFEPGGGGQDMFGDEQDAVIRFARIADDEIWQLGQSITKSGDVGRAKQQIGQWVDENPISDLLMVRESTRALSAKMASEMGSGAGAAIGGITETVGDLSDRLTIYAASIPNQARWQAQLLVYDMLDQAELESLGPTTESLADSIDRIASTIELTPDLIIQERAKTLAEIDEISNAIIDSVDLQRLATIQALANERIAVLEAVARERVAVLDAIRDERSAVFDDGGALLGVLVQDSFDRAEGLIDRIFWRAAILLAISGVGMLIIGLIVVRNYRARIIQE
jgi:hypothetical protein